jgi:glycosyltransferase involved in cell wall biosynthesis
MRPKPGARAKLRHELGLSDHHILVGNVSGLRRIKGVDLFVEAAAAAYHQHSHLRFVLVGDGELREEIEELVRKHRLETAFVMAGAADDVCPYLAAMDIAVLCSKAEGFSNSLLEYMAAELPIIATDVGGNREALAGSGILIDAGSPGLLTSAICSLLEIKVRRAHAADVFRAVQRFDIKFAEARMREIYWSYLRKNSRQKAVMGQDDATGWHDVQNISHLPAISPLTKSESTDLTGS